MAHLPRKIKAVLAGMARTIRYYSPYARMSFSQEGEDIILAKIFQFHAKGFYVDVGAHHPEKYSNTAFFYQRGWRGINIDPVPGTKTLFDKKRPRDINLEMGVAAEEATLTYYMFSPAAYNTCSPEKAAQVQHNNVPFLGTKRIPVKPLRDILHTHLPTGVEIDFLTVDVETLDLEVLQSSDWQKYRPKIVLVEMLRVDLEQYKTDAVYRFMHAQGYTLMSKAVNTSIFKRNDFDYAAQPQQ